MHHSADRNDFLIGKHDVPTNVKTIFLLREMKLSTSRLLLAFTRFTGLRAASRGTDPRGKSDVRFLFCAAVIIQHH